MIVVGLTGGIGSGKTTVAQQFASLGVAVYIADKHAKAIMCNSNEVREHLTELLGSCAYVNGMPNTSYISSVIFKNQTYLEKVNAIVHPEVASHFKKWISKQSGPYVIKEAAILFESGSYRDCNYTITVTAPEVLRIDRVLKRDLTTRNHIEAVMQNQWLDEKRLKLSDYVIENKNLEETRRQVAEIHQRILEIIL